MGGDSVQTCGAPGSPLSIYHLRQLCTFTGRDAQPVSRSNICKRDQRYPHAGKDVGRTPLLLSKKHQHSTWDPMAL